MHCSRTESVWLLLGRNPLGSWGHGRSNGQFHVSRCLHCGALFVKHLPKSCCEWLTSSLLGCYEAAEIILHNLGGAPCTCLGLGSQHLRFPGENCAPRLWHELVPEFPACQPSLQLCWCSEPVSQFLKIYLSLHTCMCAHTHLYTHTRAVRSVSLEKLDRTDQ